MSSPPHSHWPVRVAALGPVSMGSVLWRQNGQLYVTAIVKASFGFSMDAPMSCVAPLPLRRSDECARSVPSLRGASEIAPRMLEADVVLHGHAYTRGSSNRTQVRLALERDGMTLIDKTLVVVGKRRRENDEPQPFERMRIGFERALGGLEFPDNPIGVGADDDSDRMPNVLHPRDPKRLVAGLGPIPSRFPARRKLRGKLDPKVMEDGIADYPTDFTWSYFQSAPADQRVSHISGSEWLVLEGLHPTHPRIRTQLPSARAVARVYQRKDVGAPSQLELAADTLHIESDEARCSLVWRGVFPVVSQLAAEELVIAGALELHGHHASWPHSVDEVLRLASPEVDTAALAGAVDDDLQRTAVSRGALLGQRIPPAPPSVPAIPSSPTIPSTPGGQPAPESLPTQVMAQPPAAPTSAPAVLAHTQVVPEHPEPPLDDTAPNVDHGEGDAAPFPLAPAAPRTPAAAGWDQTANLNVDVEIDLDAIEEIDAIDDLSDDG